MVGWSAGMPTNLPIHQTTNPGSNPVGSHQVCQPASDSTVRGTFADVARSTGSRNIDGVMTELSCFGLAIVTSTINNNFMNANNAAGPSGIGIGHSTGGSQPPPTACSPRA
jgi:hypothetical protein